MSRTKYIYLFLVFSSFIAMPKDVHAQKNNSQENQVTGHEAFVSGGRANRAFGSESFIGGGYKNTTDGELSLVVGGQFNTTRNSFATIGGGYVNEVRGQYATIPGGWWLKAPSFGEVAVGYLNTIYAPLSSVSPHPKDRLFVLGNGRTEVVSAIETRQNRSDAFYVLKSGDAMLSGRLYQAADTVNYVNIDTFSNELTDFSNIDAVQYKWEGSTGFRNRYDTNYGLNGAQVKKYYPNLVSSDGLGYLTVDYIGFVPLLIQDSKLKDVELDTMSTIISRQQSELEVMEERLGSLEQVLLELRKELDTLKSKTELEHSIPTKEIEEQQKESNDKQ